MSTISELTTKLEELVRAHHKATVADLRASDTGSPRDEDHASNCEDAYDKTRAEFVEAMAANVGARCSQCDSTNVELWCNECDSFSIGPDNTATRTQGEPSGPVTEEFARALVKFASAAVEIDRHFPAQTEGYPPSLPSFDEAVHEILDWVVTVTQTPLAQLETRLHAGLPVLESESTEAIAVTEQELATVRRLVRSGKLTVFLPASKRLLDKGDVRVCRNGGTVQLTPTFPGLGVSDPGDIPTPGSNNGKGDSDNA